MLFPGRAPAIESLDQQHVAPVYLLQSMLRNANPRGLRERETRRFPTHDAVLIGRRAEFRDPFAAVDMHRRLRARAADGRSVNERVDLMRRQRRAFLDTARSGFQFLQCNARWLGYAVFRE